MSKYPCAVSYKHDFFLQGGKKNHPEGAATSTLEGKYLPHMCGFSYQNFKLENVILLQPSHFYMFGTI